MFCIFPFRVWLRYFLFPSLFTVVPVNHLHLVGEFVFSFSVEYKKPRLKKLLQLFFSSRFGPFGLQSPTNVGYLAYHCLYVRYASLLYCMKLYARSSLSWNLGLLLLLTSHFADFFSSFTPSIIVYYYLIIYYHILFTSCFFLQ
jgi:hypothetical protein